MEQRLLKVTIILGSKKQFRLSHWMVSKRIVIQLLFKVINWRRIPEYKYRLIKARKRSRTFKIWMQARIRKFLQIVKSRQVHWSKKFYKTN